MSVPKRSNRISRREAAQICSKIRAGFMELRNDEAIAYRGYFVFEDWNGELSRTDQALHGWVDCWSRFNTGLDLGPHDRLHKKLAPTDSGCIEFHGARTHFGYGRIGLGGRKAVVS